MSVTKKFVLFCLGGGVVVLASYPLGIALVVFVFFNLLLFGFLLLDFLITPPASCLGVRREKDTNLYFKTENIVNFYVNNPSMYPLNIEAKEDGNRFFTITDAEALQNVVKPRSEQVFSYATIPSKRGSFLFRDIYLSSKGVLGLCKKYAKVNAPVEFKVYPNIKDLSKYRLMVQKSRLLPAGDKKAPRIGLGMEFESLRPYVEGDDYRKINWAATAREMKPVVNTYQIERNQPVNILIDIGKPMSYSVKGYKKLDYAINAAIILADIVNGQGDKAGLMVFDSKVRSYVAPGQGGLHRNNLLETLYHVEDNRQIADFQGAFRQLCERQKRRSLVFVFTDFEMLEEGHELIKNMAWLKRKHLPIIVFMKNEGLEKLAQGKNTGGKRTYENILRQTADEFLGERKNIYLNLSAMGIPNVESPAEDFALTAVNKYIRLRG